MGCISDSGLIILLLYCLIQPILVAGQARTDPESEQAPSTESPQVLILNDKDFCLFLPPQPGLEVAKFETEGVPFCSVANKTPNAREFPQDFITVAHFWQNVSSNYVQVTGSMDPSKYDLQSSDGGGQYDNHASGKPNNATCQDYAYFVSIIEPDNSRFCIRCCQNEDDCPPGRSEDGCSNVIPGEYTYLDGQEPLQAPQQSTPSASSLPNKVR